MAQRRFWLFAHARYYPDGGMFDFVGSFDLVDEARAAFTLDDDREAHIYDSTDHRLVAVYGQADLPPYPSRWVPASEDWEAAQFNAEEED